MLDFQYTKINDIFLYRCGTISIENDLYIYKSYN